MNLILKNKKPVLAAVADENVPAPSSTPADAIQDLAALTTMLQLLQARNEKYQRAIEALVAARRIVQGWDKIPEPELVWSVQRDVLAALGDQDALAAFEREHAADIAAEHAARHAAQQQTLDAPARVKALERYIIDLATEMAREIDEGFIHQEMKRMFEPSAQKMLVAARAFVQAWREMTTMESVLLSRFRLWHYSIQGDPRSAYDFTLVNRRDKDDLLPTLIEGLPYEELVELNRAFHSTDNGLWREIDDRLEAAGIPAKRLTVYHPGSPHDERLIYAPDPHPPQKRPPDVVPFPGTAIVTIHR